MQNSAILSENTHNNMHFWQHFRRSYVQNLQGGHASDPLAHLHPGTAAILNHFHQVMSSPVLLCIPHFCAKTAGNNNKKFNNFVQEEVGVSFKVSEDLSVKFMLAHHMPILINNSILKQN